MGTFKKSDTNILKGIIILMLLFHHVFYDTFMSGAPSAQAYLIPSVTGIITKYGACSIFVFALLSGYGIAASMEKDMDVRRVVIRRETGLLGTFIPVYIVGLVIMVIDTRSIGALLTSVYGEDRINIIYNMFIDMLGLSNLVGAGMMNPTWWYMAAAHLIIFAVPLAVLLFKGSEKYHAETGLLIFLWLFTAFHQEGVTYIFQYCILTGITGAYLRRYRVVETISSRFASVGGRIVEAVILICLLLVYHLLYDHSGLNTYFITALFAPLMMLIVMDYVSKIKYLRNVLAVLGKYSAVIYMSHTFLIRAGFLHDFVYSFKYAFMTLGFVLIADLVFAVILKKLMEVSGWNRLLGKLEPGR